MQQPNQSLERTLSVGRLCDAEAHIRVAQFKR